MDCIFCRIVAGDVAAQVVLDEGPVLAFLDHRPVFPGHVLVVPRTHLATLADVPQPLLLPLFGAVQRVSRAVEQGLGAHGSFVAVNNKVSQSVPHLHVHVVPRRRKDGLRGFFWPRIQYASEEAMRDTAQAIRNALSGGS